MSKHRQKSKRQKIAGAAVAVVVVGAVGVPSIAQASGSGLGGWRVVSFPWWGGGKADPVADPTPSASPVASASGTSATSAPSGAPGGLSLQRRPERVAVGIQQPVRHAHLRLARRVHLAFGLSEGHKLQQRP
ncbi:hypothetical protein [Streptomyces sp. NBC_00019]|uniref:hypothetical protein n=1 Tax=Streptomyces sp. NBC_00019 TaxID=2975623 RepID=UPI003247735A